jgi:hypothetical protein
LSPYEDDEDENPMLTMKMGSIDNFTVVYWSGEEATKEMTLETYKDGMTKHNIPTHASLEKVATCYR